MTLFTINVQPPTTTESAPVATEHRGVTVPTSTVPTFPKKISIYSSGKKVPMSQGIIDIMEEFKGKVFDQKVQLHKNKMKDAVDHPFNFDILLKLYKKFGLVTAIVDKYVDFIVGSGFTIKTEDPKAQKIIDDFIKDNHFENLMRQWIKEALLTGNGYLELGGLKDKVPTEMKILCSRNMFIARNDKGVLTEYFQYNPSLFGQDPEPFQPHQIAHLSINRIGDDAYGTGIIYPMLHVINDFIKARKDMHTILKRKANSPLWAKLGDAEKGIVPTPEAVADYGKTMEFMNEKQEWATDPYVNFEVIDFGNVGEKFVTVLEQDLKMISVTSQVPEVLLGYGNIPEGLAVEQKEAFEKRAHSFQIDIEKTVETDIFSRVLLSDDIGTKTEFVWGRPSRKEIQEEITKITELLKNFMITDDLRYKLEDRLYELLDFKAREETPEEEKKRKDNEPQPTVPGQEAPGTKRFPPDKEKPKPNPNKSEEMGHDMITHCQCKGLSPDMIHEDLQTDYSLREWVGFDYDTFKQKIVQFLKEDDFKFLAARDQLEELAGRLSVGQVDKLRKVMITGYNDGSSINEIAKNIREKVKPNVLYATDEKGNILKKKNGSPYVLASEKVRPYVIARTEAVRSAAIGSLMQYSDETVEKVQFVAAITDRTCPTCMGLSNNIYTLKEARDIIPVHVMCRCTWIPVVAL